MLGQGQLEGKTSSPAARTSPYTCRGEACQQETPDICLAHLEAEQDAASPGEAPISLGPNSRSRAGAKTNKSSLRDYPKLVLGSKQRLFLRHIALLCTLPGVGWGNPGDPFPQGCRLSLKLESKPSSATHQIQQQLRYCRQSPDACDPPVGKELKQLTGVCQRTKHTDIIAFLMSSVGKSFWGTALALYRSVTLLLG